MINIKGSGALAASITESLMRHHDRRATVQSRRWPVVGISIHQDVRKHTDTSYGCRQQHGAKNTRSKIRTEATITAGSHEQAPTTQYQTSIIPIFLGNYIRKDRDIRDLLKMVGTDRQAFRALATLVAHGNR